MLTEDIQRITSINATKSYYKDKIILADNLDQTFDTQIKNQTLVYNDQYRCAVLVLQGVLNLTINGISIKVKGNEYIAIMPFTNIVISNSRCKFVCVKAEAFITHYIFRKIDIDINDLERCYTFSHYRLTPHQTEILVRAYLHMKEDMYNPLFKRMRSDILKARLCAFISHILSFVERAEPISHYEENETTHLFYAFMDLLNQNYKQERSVQFYSDKLGIQPKVLSAITYKYTGKTASKIIDEFIILHIKVVLYENNQNIKEVSEMFNFTSQSFFGRYFKRIVGCSPRKYISANSKKLTKQS